MPGYGTKLVTLPDDDTVHLLAEGERTECGLPLPIDAAWTYANRDGEDATCKACTKQAERVESLTAEAPRKKAGSGSKA